MMQTQAAAKKCPNCGNDVPMASIGRPRRFCCDLCANSFNNESKRLVRDLENAERELDRCLAREWWINGHVYRLSAASLRDECEKLKEQLAVRRVPL
jgi:endogenous inhibitor of DNA gyrase (YacG/DUF329 family)